jgi:nitrogen fixation protein FixH
MPTVIEGRGERAPDVQTNAGTALTGRGVLMMLVAFFAVIIAVNLVMMKAAVQSFSGLGEKNAYLAGMSHDRALAAARAQEQRGWSVEARLDRLAPGRTQVVVMRSNVGGGFDAPLAARAIFEHPADSRQDRGLALAAGEAGAWSGALDLPEGAWDFSIELRSGDEVLFRSRERVRIRDGS